MIEGQVLWRVLWKEFDGEGKRKEITSYECENYLKEQFNEEFNLLKDRYLLEKNENA